jgi:hypothetical protein
MAFTPTNQLTSDASITLRSQQHASRLFVDDQFRLAPKLDFQFHVAFSLNQGALKTIDLAQRHASEIGMLVKNVDLPGFVIESKLVNQYNRKKVIQTKATPSTITIKFHDDNMGVINQLWQNYYSYYYADSNSANQVGAYNRTATRSSDFITTNYGFDNSSTAPFFNYIKIYQLARHEYIGYRLVNPLIQKMEMGKVNYESTKTHEISMTIQCEAVSYESGMVDDGGVEGFAQTHYDTTPSPLYGGASGTSASPTFTNQSSLTSNALDFLNNLKETVNSYQNTKDSTPVGLQGLSSPSTSQSVGGLQGINFPQSPVVLDTTTIAKKINIG